LRDPVAFPTGSAGLSAQHAFIVLVGLLSYSGFHGRLTPSIKMLVEGDLCSFQITPQVTFAQPLSQVGLRFPHGPVDGSIVVSALVRFTITTEINPNEPSVVAPCDDLTNFVSRIAHCN
jgi:hypothetical protein